MPEKNKAIYEKVEKKTRIKQEEPKNNSTSNSSNSSSMLNGVVVGCGVLSIAIISTLMLFQADSQEITPEQFLASAPVNSYNVRSLSVSLVRDGKEMYSNTGVYTNLEDLYIGKKCDVADGLKCPNFNYIELYVKPVEGENKINFSLSSKTDFGNMNNLNSNFSIPYDLLQEEQTFRINKHWEIVVTNYENNIEKKEEPVLTRVEQKKELKPVKTVSKEKVVLVEKYVNPKTKSEAYSLTYFEIRNLKEAYAKKISLFNLTASIDGYYNEKIPAQENWEGINKNQNGIINLYNARLMLFKNEGSLEDIVEFRKELLSKISEVEAYNKEIEDTIFPEVVSAVEVHDTKKEI